MSELGEIVLKHEAIEANGITIHTVLAGLGPPVLLLHGWPFNWYLWHRVIPGLVEAGFRVIAPDLRGIGESSKPESGYDLLTLADDHAGLLRSLDAENVTVIAFDLGVQSAVMLAMRYPKLVRRLILSEALIGKLPGAEAFLQAGAPWWFGFHGTPGLAENVLAGNEAPYLNWFFEHSTVQKLSERSREEYVRAYTGREALRGGFAHYRAFQLDATQIESQFKDSRLVQPTLVIGGGVVNDAPLLQLKPFASDLQYRHVSDCGHVVPQEQPEQFLAHVLSFINTSNTAS